MPVEEITRVRRLDLFESAEWVYEHETRWLQGSLSRWESLPTHLSRGNVVRRFNDLSREERGGEGHLAPSNARSLFGRLFLVRRSLFAHEADFPIFR